MAQRIRFDNPRARTAALSLLLFAVNVYVCRELFWIEYLRHTGSIEAAFISIARYARDNWRDLSWFPLWYNGIPYQNSYPPVLHWMVALVSGVTGWSPALAYHAVTAFLYCAGPVTLFWLCYRLSRSHAASFMAGLIHSLMAPSAFLIADVRRDMGGVLRPRRLQTLVVYGEGPHVAGLTLLAISILLLDVANEKRRPVYYLLAAVSFAATALTNWLAAAALAIAVLAYVLAGETASMRRRITAALIIGVFAYALAAPLVPPSTVRTIQFNARTIEGDYTQYAKGLPMRLAAVAAALALAKYLLVRFRSPRTLEFGVYFTIVAAAIALGWEYARIVFVPQPHRYHVEMEWGIAVLIAFAGATLPWRAPLCIALALSIWFAKSDRGYARYILEPIDMTQRIEYKMARWIEENARGTRVMVPGSSSFWLNAFTGAPQLGGGFDQGTTNFLIRVAEYVLYSSDGTGDRDAEISIAWLRAFGVGAVATGGPASGEYYKPYRNPRKFAGRLEVLWRDGDDALYRVPGDGSLAHVMRPSSLPSRTPVNGIDIEPLAPYLAALDDASLPRVNLRWTSRHSAEITADLRPGEIVSVQVSHHPGWQARANGRELTVRADALGQLVVEPGSAGPARIELFYDGGTEMAIARILRWLAILGGGCWILVANFDVRKRVARPGGQALS